MQTNLLKISNRGLFSYDHEPETAERLSETFLYYPWPWHCRSENRYLKILEKIHTADCSWPVYLNFEQCGCRYNADKDSVDADTFCWSKFLNTCSKG